ncbi:magnesium transporter [Martelella lutilitoris]|uniref:Magnesium transporter MgtE n=1 Tax=Martelella lutilitoris TaxID=2583532 RepID=A0A7T7HHD4_9HYPH|nr:magnesium transporter [Martelella lutilitoris]QQM29187.1 magnesium transporter [Martelella lutilitoris]
MSHLDEEVLKETEARETTDDIYNEEGSVSAEFLAGVQQAIAEGNTDYLREEVANLHESELGDVIEALDYDSRPELVRLLGDEFDLTALTEVDEAIRLDIIESLPSEQLVSALSALDSDDAVYILEDLEDEERENILAKLPFTERIRLTRSLDYPESSAGRRMQTEFVAVPPFWTVGQTIDYMREDDDLPDSFSQIFVVDPTFRLLGAVDLDSILRTKRQVKIETIMRETNHPIDAELDQEEAAQVFEQYDLLSAAVVDNNGRLVGVLTIDDVVDVIHEEADEDIKRLGGVGDEELSDNVVRAVRSRFGWLLINMGTAFMSASVIGLFDESIGQMIALAVLMPVVASMGGNAGTQTMTVTVRALATRDLDIYNAARIIRREAGVGLFNGVVFALLIALVAGYWFDNPQLGGVVAAAMIINMFAAAMAGILIPLFLDRAGADPAISSSVFVTTTTDVIGFFSFLGIATWWFNI